MNKFLLTLGSLLVCLSPSSAERLHLESYAHGLDTVPVAVVAFKPAAGSASLKENLPWDVIAADLDFTCRFRVTRLDKVDSALFAKLGIGVVIDGEYSIDNGGTTLDCYVHDAVSLDLLMGKKFRGDAKSMRNMAHRFADQIAETMFGEKGIFESKIVYVRNENGSKNLWLADFDGHNTRQLTNTNTVNVFPAFIDSTDIIWTSFLRGKPDLYKGSITGGKSQVFVASRYVQTSPAASPVVGKIAYACSKTGAMQIYTCNYDGTDTKQLTFNKAINTAPCWSPNGNQIAFTSDRTGTPQIYVMDADGANVRRATHEGHYQDSPAWSPKGDLIAYSSLVDGKFDIYTVKPDGSEATKVTSASGNNSYPAWSPDGRHILYSSGWAGTADLWVIRPDGTGLRRITNSGNADMPDWGR